MTIAATALTAPQGAGQLRRALSRIGPARGEGALERWLFRGVLAFFVLLIAISYAVPLWYQAHGDRLLVVTSGSMAPEIQAGDAVVIRPVTDASQLRVGQVVTFYPGKSTALLTHRIVALTTVVRRDEATDRALLDQYGNPVADPFIKTKGDANTVLDPNLTPATQVRGIVREIHPAWGYPLGWAHSPLGRLLLFGPPLLMLLGAEVLSRLPGRNRRKPAGNAPAALDEEHDDAPVMV